MSGGPEKLAPEPRLAAARGALAAAAPRRKVLAGLIAWAILALLGSAGVDLAVLGLDPELERGLLTFAIMWAVPETRRPVPADIEDELGVGGK